MYQSLYFVEGVVRGHEGRGLSRLCPEDSRDDLLRWLSRLDCELRLFDRDLLNLEGASNVAGSCLGTGGPNGPLVSREMAATEEEDPLGESGYVCRGEATVE